MVGVTYVKSVLLRKQVSIIQLTWLFIFELRKLTLEEHLHITNNSIINNNFIHFEGHLPMTNN